MTLSPQVAKSYGKNGIPLTLKVKVEGTAAKSPYTGDAGIFSVTQDDRDMARDGKSAPQAVKSSRMKVIGAAGIGAGSVLVLGLGVWTLLARRRAATAPAAASGGNQPYGGPPQAW